MVFRSRSLLLALVLALPAGEATAQFSVQPATRDVHQQVPGTYQVDPDHTEILFSVSHLGFSFYYGMFSGASGTLDFTPADPGKMHVEISVPVSSVHTPSEKLTGFLRSADWLDAQHYPVMTFRSTSVTPTGAGSADVTGDLSLHGVTKRVTWHAVFTGGGVNPIGGARTVGFSATGSIKRSEFGVDRLVPTVGDEVGLTITASFQK